MLSYSSVKNRRHTETASQLLDAELHTLLNFRLLRLSVIYSSSMNIIRKEGKHTHNSRAHTSAKWEPHGNLLKVSPGESVKTFSKKKKDSFS